MTTRLMSFALMCMLALSSLQMAAARGQADPFSSMVICNGNGTMTVFLDAEGEPVQMVHLCPDCALHAFSLVFPDTEWLHVPATRVAARWITVGQHADWHMGQPATARGPPLVI